MTQASAVDDSGDGTAFVRVRLDLAYDGSEFHGWAAQPGLRTVQGELEAALAVLLRRAPGEVALTVGGRTDAGVHARGQVAHLDVSRSELEKWAGSSRRAGGSGTHADAAHEHLAALRARKLVGVLSRTAADIVVHRVLEVPAEFDARFSALRRRYEYRIRDPRAKRDPLTSHFTVDIGRDLDLSLMRRASESLLGLNDFTSFCKAREGATAVRTLLSFEWRQTEDGAYAARIEADAFCHSMVRALVGAAVAVGSGRIGLAELEEIRMRRERTSRFSVMPAHGLSLEEIAYPRDDELAVRAERTRARRAPLDRGV
ncbi:tRNA pseudouridine(38-40) synthase TruA [Leucobacter sp. GX24907]